MNSNHIIWRNIHVRRDADYYHHDTSGGYKLQLKYLQCTWLHGTGPESGISLFNNGGRRPVNWR
eukprot:scaffold3831_cov246-Chaetoceros_neogracile.AAC.4